MTNTEMEKKADDMFNNLSQERQKILGQLALVLCTIDNGLRSLNAEKCESLFVVPDEAKKEFSPEFKRMDAKLRIILGYAKDYQARFPEEEAQSNLFNLANVPTQ